MFNRRIAAGTLLLLLAACSSVSERLTVAAEADPAIAVERATVWLARHGPEHAQWAAVRRVQAEAAFALVNNDPFFQAYRTFRNEYAEQSDLVAAAAQLESSLYFQEVTVPAGTVNAYRDFRAQYPDSDLVPSARAREVREAYRVAVAVDGVSGLRAFLRRYRDWDEAFLARQDARTLVLERTLEAAVEAGGAAPLQSWLEEYGDSAVGTHVVERAQALLRAERAREEIDTLLGTSWSLRELDPWLDPRTDFAPFRSAAAARKDDILASAEAAGTHQAHLVAGRLLEALPDGKALLVAAADGYFQNAEVSAEWALESVRHFPADTRAWEAEGRWMAFAQPGIPRSRHTAISRIRDAERGLTELTVDVADCTGERVAGLTRESFKVYEGAEPLEIQSFEALEQDRPLTIEVVLDLSGSMATERRAVLQALAGFVETLRFRNRATRVGLVGFSDGVAVNLAPSSDLPTLQRELKALPMNFGGGAAEDGVGGLLTAGRRLRTTKGERALILLSDEPLQANLEGRRGLNLQETPCDRARSLGGCVSTCDGRPNCLVECVRYGPAEYASGLKGCSSSQAAHCASRAFDRAARKITECEGRNDHPELVDKLAGRLSQDGVRLFVLAPARASGEYRRLAKSLGGRAVNVPDDARDPSPYEEALHDIADQLSKQYVMRVHSSSGASLSTVATAPLRFLASETVSSGGHDEATREVHLRGAYDAWLRVGEDGGIERSLDGETWRQVLTSDLVADDSAGFVSAGSASTIVCTLGKRETICSTDAGRSWVGVASPGGTGEPRLQSWGGVIRLLDGDGTWELREERARDIASSELYFGTNSDQFEATLVPFIDDLASRLVQDPSLTVVVEGHADTRGTAEHNEDLARRRARRVGQAIESRGVESNRIAIRSYGETRPVRHGQSASDHKRNRRVELVVVDAAQRDESGCLGPL